MIFYKARPFVSTNFKDTPSIFYGGVGFSWRYDAKYKEVQMRFKDEKSKKNKKGKKSKKRKEDEDSIKIEQKRKSTFE